MGTRLRRRPLEEDGVAAQLYIRHLRVALCTHQPTTPRTNGVAPSCMADARGRSETHPPLPLQQRLGMVTCCNPSPVSNTYTYKTTPTHSYNPRFISRS